MATSKRKPVTETTPELVAEDIVTEAIPEEPQEEPIPEEPKIIENEPKAEEKPEKTRIRTTSGHKEPQEGTYAIADLIKAHRIFQTTHEIVAVALKLSGIERATIKEAEKIIEEFKNKEVK